MIDRMELVRVNFKNRTYLVAEDGSDMYCLYKHPRTETMTLRRVAITGHRAWQIRKHMEDTNGQTAKHQESD
jgi:hypothetical protein